MNYAIIAAGEGSRLVADGVFLPKPLIKINGIPLLDRIINIFLHNNASSISVVINEQMNEVKDHLEKIKMDIPFHRLACSTPSSMHSFFKLAPFLKSEKFCLTTIDTIFQEDEFAAFIRTFEEDEENDGMMVVTDYIDDEKPLYVSIDEKYLSIKAFRNTPAGGEKYISGGIYGLTPKAFRTLDRCMDTGISRMSNYQQQLIVDGLKLKAYPFKKIIDVDRVQDIEKAEKFLLKQEFLLQNPKIIGIRRDPKYSPNCIENDAAIFNLTVKHLKQRNCEIIEYSESEFLESDTDADIIFNMARGIKTVQKLQELENQGKTVINSGYGIENCRPAKMASLLLAHEMPCLKSFIISTEAPLSPDIKFAGNYSWIKRGDFHVCCKEDIFYIPNKAINEDMLRQYASRGIKNLVISEHIEGDLVKFYGIAGTNFFYWFYPDIINDSKFGWETINGKTSGIPFDPETLKKICNQAAQALNIYIYGGDCIIQENGKAIIIDFNDWPTFAPCRNEAIPYIAEKILQFRK